MPWLTIGPKARLHVAVPVDVTKYKAVGFEKLPLVLGVDVARFGDDQTVIGTRQGRKASILGKHRGLDTVQTAERVIEHIQKLNPDGVVVDGDGIGAGVIDQIRFRGFDLFRIEVAARLEWFLLFIILYFFLYSFFRNGNKFGDVQYFILPGRLLG